MNIWVKRFLLVALGSVGGFAYYYFIGCNAGTCPITSSPYISTAYGALIGGILAIGEKKKPPHES